MLAVGVQLQTLLLTHATADTVELASESKWIRVGYCAEPLPWWILLEVSDVFEVVFTELRKSKRAERECAIDFCSPQMSFLFLPRVKGVMLFHLQVEFLKIQLACPVAMATKRQAAFICSLKAAFNVHQQTNHLWETSFSSDTEFSALDAFITFWPRCSSHSI